MQAGPFTVLRFCVRLRAGITFSNDKVLQSRVFSYQDTQRYRIGNHYNMLPINAPKCPFHINNEDGAQNWMFRDNEVCCQQLYLCFV